MKRCRVTRVAVIYQMAPPHVWMCGVPSRGRDGPNWLRLPERSNVLRSGACDLLEARPAMTRRHGDLSACRGRATRWSRRAAGRAGATWTDAPGTRAQRGLRGAERSWAVPAAERGAEPPRLRVTDERTDKTRVHVPHALAWFGNDYEIRAIRAMIGPDGRASERTTPFFKGHANVQRMALILRPTRSAAATVRESRGGDIPRTSQGRLAPIAPPQQGG
jgi:hypothetical protein